MGFRNGIFRFLFLIVSICASVLCRTIQNNIGYSPPRAQTSDEYNTYYDNGDNYDNDDVFSNPQAEIVDPSRSRSKQTDPLDENIPQLTLGNTLQQMKSVKNLDEWVPKRQRYHPITTNCPDCELEKQRKLLSEMEIRTLRLEHIKRQILNKLRLDKPPNITINRNAIPDPIAESEFIPELEATHVEEGDKNIDEFFGRTTQVIIFGEKTPGACMTDELHPKDCFTFDLSKLRGQKVTSAKLWAFKLRDPSDTVRRNQTLVVNEIYSRHFRRLYPNVNREKRVAVSSTTLKKGWLQFDVKHIVRDWRHGRTRAVEIVCKTCDRNPEKNPVASHAGSRPFLVINISGKRQRRSRRSLDCHSVNSTCCKESFYVSFEEIGFNWILSPRGFHANYCRGSCHGELGRSSRHHALVMQLAGLNERDPFRQRDLLPCCTPTTMSSLSVLHTENDGHVYKTILPNMIAESCGCS